MWVRRTEQEVAKWHEITHRDARSNALLMVIGIGVLMAVLGAGGWIMGPRTGFVYQVRSTASHRLRTPIIVALAIPFSIWFYRHRKAKELGEALRLTRCLDCGRAGKTHQGTACECGGTIVHQSELKWVDA